MNEGAPLVLELLGYIEEVEKLKAKPAFSVPNDFFCAFQNELIGLPELSLNIQAGGDDVWLRIPRLQEIGAPDPGTTLKPWVVLSKTPDTAPQLRGVVETHDGKVLTSRIALEEAKGIQELFDWYVEYQWTPWAGAERERRRTIKRYNQLFSLQQAIASDGAETSLELVWGIGTAVWKKPGYATPVKHPLLIQPCEITLNERTFELEIRPRDIEPRLEVGCYSEMEIAGVRQLDAFWKSYVATSAQRVNPFEESTFDGVLKAAVGHLDPTGAYELRTGQVATPAPTEKLNVSNTWVIFARKRSADIFIEDIKRLKKSVESSESLPAVIKSFVQQGDSTVRVQPEKSFRGLSSSDSSTDALELYFPMPYNDEQVSIIRKLESNDGVVVQGPPGTGKTHTIANVICHYLAQGKRVLVTAKGESALAVLQDKLPEQIRPLSVSLLADERDGMKQFEHSIQTIASNVAALDPVRAQARIVSSEAKLQNLHARIAHVDQTVAAYASKHMRNYTFQGKEVTPEDMAKSVIEQSDLHDWFDDVPPASLDGTLPFTDVDIDALRAARIAVGADLSYWNSTIPATRELPDWSELVLLHRDVVRARGIEQDVTQGAILALVDSRDETFEKASATVVFLEERSALAGKIQAMGEHWINELAAKFEGTEASDPLLTALFETGEIIQGLESQRRDLLPKALVLPQGAETNDDFISALERLVEGKSAFALPFGKGDTRKLVSSVSVLAAPPKTTEDWLLIGQLVEWRVKARKVIAKWNALASEFSMSVVTGEPEECFRALAHLQGLIRLVRQKTFEYDAALFSRLEEVFGRQVAEQMWDGGEPFIDSALAGLRAHLDKGRLAYALNRLIEIRNKLQPHSGAVVSALSEFLAEKIGQESQSEPELERAWSALLNELDRLGAVRPSWDVIKEVSRQIESGGAANWARRIRVEPAGIDHDRTVPVTWRDAWNWRQALIFLEQIDGHGTLRHLFEERRVLTNSLSSTYQELVAEKTWLGVFNNSPTSVRQALQAYLNAVQAMGAGTGVRAVRHRKNARDAMQRAYQAVPCWVLPQWRVSETIPAEVGLFDLVVIDEASQSDIWALPALLRGKKLLIVGDHKQVSPSAVGTAEEKIKELSSRFLANQPHGSEMTPDKSIYDLARVVFAGNSVMLKEHFRCVPAIIEFSNREFYEGDIRPLRIPSASERLDPPLIDVFVKGGHRQGDTNPGEAIAIVDQIAEILADGTMAGRTIGIVTLLGNAQAAYINELVQQRISQSDVVSRKIQTGAPTVFQGRERDIMLVSMVVGQGDRAAANRADMFQRFNVALSRARDRMYLFRSVPETAFKEDTLNAKVLRHFREPFTKDVKRIQNLRERCESGFELEMFDALVQRGYRVEPQVPCGGYRIDFVVEGAEGRRLAVECDGDRFHGPGQWGDDMARQRVLERAGWTFWRCFASSFARKKEEMLADLVSTLTALGIEPLGAESVDNTAWVQYKEVDPFGVDTDEQEAA